MKKFLLLLLLSCSSRAIAAGARMISYDTKSDFSRGDAKNIAMTADGFLKPAPTRSLLFDSSELFIWSIAADSKGRLYVSAGHQGKVFRVDESENGELFKADEPMVFSLAVDAADQIYAATSPMGKIYRINQAGAQIFYDPDDQYIWDMRFDRRGNLLAATGGKSGRILKIDQKGQAAVIYAGEESHIRTLCVRQDGALVFGSSNQGLIYQLTDEGKPFVIFDPQMEEVQKIIESPDGILYAAVQGRTIFPAAVTRSEGTESPAAETEIDDEGEGDEAATAAQIIVAEKAAIAPSTSALYRIQPSGYGKNLWVAVDDQIQTIALYEKNRLLVGSGKSGRIHTINSKGELSLLFETDEAQITCFHHVKDDIVFSTANPARLYRLNPELSDSSTFTSDPFDAGVVSKWGKLHWEGQGTLNSISFFTRSGNTEQPSASWSDWASVEMQDQNYAVKSPPARFIQWKAAFFKRESYIDKVTISYIQHNIAPEITFVEVHAPGDFYESESKRQQEGILFPAPLGAKIVKSGFRTIDWSFDDPNFDLVQFALYYKQKDQRHWRTLAENLSSNFYSWDTASMADGWYDIKIVVDDSLSNVGSNACHSEDISQPFLVDNTPPVLVSGTVKRTSENRIAFEIKDEWNIIKQVEYSIDAKKWQPINPTDGICDSRIESYMIAAAGAGAGAHELAIKASDYIGNSTVFHLTIND